MQISATNGLRSCVSTWKSPRALILATSSSPAYTSMRSGLYVKTSLLEEKETVAVCAALLRVQLKGMLVQSEEISCRYSRGSIVKIFTSHGDFQTGQL